MSIQEVVVRSTQYALRSTQSVVVQLLLFFVEVANENGKGRRGEGDSRCSTLYVLKTHSIPVLQEVLVSPV